MRIGLLLALATIPATVLAQTPAPPAPAPLTAEESFAKGVQLQQSGDVLGAIEAYQDALGKEPQRTDARSNARLSVACASPSSSTCSQGPRPGPT